MAAIVHDDSFSATLRRFMESAGVSMTKLAGRSALDISYVSRLVNLSYDPLNPRVGERPRQPSRDTVIRLAWALHLSLEDTDELLLAAGYAPLIR